MDNKNKKNGGEEMTKERDGYDTMTVMIEFETAIGSMKS